MPKYTQSTPTYWTEEQLVPLQQREQDITLIDRPALADLTRHVAHLPVGTFRREVSHRRIPSIVNASMSALSLTSRELSNELELLIRSFMNCFNLRKANYRLELVNQQTCPKFHVDRVFLRVLQTFVGPTTQYCLVNSQTTVMSAPVGSIVFLKGLLNPTYSQQLLHRSPPMEPTERRLCAVLDFS